MEEGRRSSNAAAPHLNLSFGLPVLAPRAHAIATWAVAIALLAWSLPLHLVDVDGAVNFDTIAFWVRRTHRFWVAIGKGDWSGTFLSPHPGALSMWLAGASLKLHGVVGATLTAERVRPFYFPVALMNGCVPVLIYLAAARVLGRSGFPIAVALGALWITEPILVAFGRVSYLDVPFACWSALALWLCAMTLRTRRFRWCVLAGACMGLAAATRVQAAAVVLVGIGAWFSVPFLQSRARDTRVVAFLLVLGLVTLLVLAFLWPTLLFDPVGTATKLFKASRELTGSTHRTFFMGRTKGVGNGFYAAVLLFLTSYATFWCALVGVVVVARNAALRPLAIGFSLAYAPYLAAILWSSKKVARYLTDTYGLVLFLAAVGLVWLAGALFGFLSRRARALQPLVAVIALSLCVGRTARLVAYIPDVAAWCADYPGLRCDDFLAFRPFIGLRDTSRWIERASGDQIPKVWITYWSDLKLMPWINYKPTRRARDADYIVVINSSLVRGFKSSFVRRLMKQEEPAYRFILGGREYVRVYVNEKRARAR
jgi:hypothetical protein